MNMETPSSDSTANQDFEPLELLETRTNSFIVVIRSLPGTLDHHSAEWRGSVMHAQSRERIYFREFSRLVEFIAHHCECASPPSSWLGQILLRLNKIGLTRFFRLFKAIRLFLFLAHDGFALT